MTAAESCPRCGEPHSIVACPHVKAVELHDGDFRFIKRVEFLTPADFPQRSPAPAAADEKSDDYPKIGAAYGPQNQGRSDPAV